MCDIRTKTLAGHERFEDNFMKKHQGDHTLGFFRLLSIPVSFSDKPFLFVIQVHRMRSHVGLLGRGSEYDASLVQMSCEFRSYNVCVNS